MIDKAISTAALCALTACATTQSGSPLPARFEYSDVARFYAIYDAAGGHPDSARLQKEYIDTGSPGLHDFIPNRIISGKRLARIVAQNPAIYADARKCSQSLPKVRPAFERDMRKFLRIYPEATIPNLTMVIGANNSGGTATDAGVIIGVEVVCRANAPSPLRLDHRLRHLIAHEIAHASQRNQKYETVLDDAMREGVAELVAELISGEVSNDHLKLWTRGKEAQIEREFSAQMLSTDPDVKKRWLYSGVGTPDKPGDLSYWVGYRIARAYYDRATDKHAALRRLLTDADNETIVRESGWAIR
ncbi:MAG TPA: DUF2268 domain-containing putative Zn-dependent protease [Gemmatimonadaceae bacterium]|nr:DUF2268 domain-containing putative Zn-dependent protease [Gemmatimonadaceae bacterium]